MKQNRPLEIIGDARSSEHVPFRQSETANALSPLSFLSQKILLVNFQDRRPLFELIKVVFSLSLISDNQYKFESFSTLISVTRYKD